MGIFGGVINILVSFLLPLGLCAFLLSRRLRAVIPIVSGVFSYAVFNILLLTVVLLPALSRAPWFILLMRSDPLGYALFIGFLTALVEEAGRLLSLFGMRRAIRRDVSVYDGLAFGVGYGGIESVLVGANTLVSLFLLGGVMQPAEAIFGGMERVSMLMAHIAWSTMALRSLDTKKPWHAMLAFLLHTVFASLTVLNEQGAVAGWIVQIILFAGAAAMLLLCLAPYRPAAPAEDAAPVSEQPDGTEPAAAEPRADD